ncbi:hypothetical protein Ddye_017359 [Dipteronia dyeriana]|uniref:Reverse transcriptase zinc-binding domain-containing protein n=1 Tax=Dipteronia dyeriana TaxID=168575 RepID=A0AAD9U9J3_9ROSI|nr:hypothetical protein Ddye_017359 [Dipteronia dyeriana]
MERRFGFMVIDGFQEVMFHSLYHPQHMDGNNTVDQLKLTNGDWNIQKIKRIFVQSDVDGILQIPAGIGNLEDKRVWSHDKSGIFTVKSGYWVGRKLGKDQERDSSSNRSDWWKYLWHLEIPQKIKNFIWKVCYDWIPTYGNLRKRGIDCDEICKACDSEGESTIHALWDCPILKYAREWWLPPGKLGNCKFNYVLDLFGFYSKRLSKIEMELFCVIIWKIWCCRNDRIHNGNCLDVNEVVWWSRNFIDERRLVGCNKIGLVVNDERK